MDGMQKWSSWSGAPGFPDKKKNTAAKSEKLTPIKIDKVDCFGYFQGSHGRYETFLDECDFRKSQTETIPLANLYATWEKWRTENGYKSMNSRTFGARLRGLGLDVRKIGRVSKVYLESNADLPA